MGHPQRRGPDERPYARGVQSPQPVDELQLRPKAAVCAVVHIAGDQQSESWDSRLGYGGLVCLQGGHLRTLPFDDLRDPATGRTRIRRVDIHSEHYISAWEYMIRLKRHDLADPEIRAKLAEAANLSPEEFARTFASGVELAAEAT